MIEAYVEISGEAPELAAAEAQGAAEALGGGTAGPEPAAFDHLEAVRLPSEDDVRRLATRLALAHRCLLPVAPGESFEGAIRREGARGRSAAFRRVGGSPGGLDDGIRAAGRSYRAAGGSIDLEAPERRFWIARARTGQEALLLEVAAVDRRESARRRMPLLPFQRPVALAPRLARAAANLARVRPGDQVVDPFVGTGALLAEAALLGARVYGIDRDPTMVRGALQNFRHLGVEPTELLEGDAGAVDFQDPSQRFEALLTDLPYGRSSSTGGEAPDSVSDRVIPRWARSVEPSGRIVAIVRSGASALDLPGRLVRIIPVRVHRSLTREFRVYESAR